MEQNYDFLSQLIACCLFIIGLRSFFSSLNSGRTIDLDNIELFTITEKQVPEQRVRERKPKPKPKPKPKKKKPKGYTRLQKDCFEALKALGFKSIKERQFMVNETFNKHNPKTIQEFLKIAISRPANYEMP